LGEAEAGMAAANRAVRAKGRERTAGMRMKRDLAGVDGSNGGRV